MKAIKDKTFITVEHREVFDALVSGCFAVVLVLWAGVADAQTTLVRTGQMWGADKSEGKVDAVVGIAGECVQTGNDLACQFVSLSLSADDLFAAARYPGFDRERVDMPWVDPDGNGDRSTALCPVPLT